MAIPPTPESTPTPGPTSPAPPAPAPPPPLAGAPYAMPPGPLAARAPGQPTYYPQQAYYAPGWTAPAATSPRRSRRGLWLAIGGGLVVLLVVGGAAGGVPGLARRRWRDPFRHGRRRPGRLTGTVHQPDGLGRATRTVCGFLSLVSPRAHPRRRRAAGEGVLSYTHLRAHETDSYLVCRLLLEK